MPLQNIYSRPLLPQSFPTVGFPNLPRFLPYFLPHLRLFLARAPTLKKSVVWSAPVSLDRVKAVKNKLGVTVNDVMVGTLASALRRHMLKAGEPVEDVRKIGTKLAHSSLFAPTRSFPPLPAATRCHQPDCRRRHSSAPSLTAHLITSSPHHLVTFARASASEAPPRVGNASPSPSSS